MSCAEIFILVIVTFGFIIAFAKLSFLQDEVDDLENEVAYQKDLTFIKEYVELKDGREFHRSGSSVGYYVGLNPWPQHIKISEVRSKTKELKSVLEKNCPKKCTTRKKK